ncbi:hypothetical protein VAPA_1c35430 [Variovorax paradoxus B4]|uniref:Uncharacterized protein n=1 Tax=Variovorax paradoxus B4 TaxID=1246301 RepID=T1XCJ1_VARPD|nr:hypothetical protein [Variovorax paradoxus]AGU50627.1 hypothetical protein VAPA_1c35430 [Variovorax paradoxus B4]
MQSESPAAAAPSLPEGRFDGREAFAGIVRAALSSAARQGWRELVFSDPDFADWPLGERASIEALQAWSATGRRFMLLAQRFDVVERSHARFVPWRRMWDHIIECRTVRTEAGSAAVPSAIWTPEWFVHRTDPERSRGLCGFAPRARRELRETMDESWRTGRPAFPASASGL